MSRALTALALGAAAASITRAASAQAPPAALEVQVIGEQPAALQGVPGSGAVIDARELRRADPWDVAEVLRRVPGLVVRQEESAGLRLDISVRGLDATRGRHVLVLEDGVPLTVNPYAEPDLYVGPAIERTRSIEVVKGSGSILFGPQTIGGVINFLTLALPEGREAKLEVDGGEHAYARVLGRYGDAIGSTRFVVQAFHKQGNGFRDEDFRADDVLAKVGFRTGGQGEATIKLGFHDERARSTEVGLTEPMYLADPRRPGFTPDDALHVRRIEVSLLDEEHPTPALTVRTLAYAYTTSRLWRRQDYDRAPVPGVAYQRVVGDPSVPGGALYFRSTNSLPDRTFDVAGLEPRITWRAAAGPTSSELEAGLRVLVESGHRQQRAGATPTSDAGALLLDESHSTVAFAGYVEDRLRFRDDLSVFPGVRVEHWDYHREVARTVVAGVARDVSLAGDSGGSAVIPGIGVSVGPANAHAFGGVHVGFAPPPVETAIGATGVDQRLAAERSVAYELGARVTVRRIVHVEATGFLSNFENQLIPSSAGGPGAAGLVNAGQTRHLGVEGAAQLRLGAALGLGAAIDLGARATLARATFVNGANAGGTLPYAPLWTASATLDVEHPVGLGAEVAWSFVSEQLSDAAGTVAVDVTGRSGRLPPYHVVDVGVRYREPRTRLTVRVTAKNLLDSTYVVSRRPDGIFIGAPRQITAGLSWDYH